MSDLIEFLGHTLFGYGFFDGHGRPVNPWMPHHRRLRCTKCGVDVAEGALMRECERD